MLDDYLRLHDGVITLAQARRSGLNQDCVDRRVRSSQWRRCAQGVYFVDDRPFTAAARVRATVWGYGPRATASGLAAAWWLGLSAIVPGLVEVTVPRPGHGRSHPGSRLRRRNLAAADIVEKRGLRVTSPALTAIEAAVRRGGGSASIMDTALQGEIDLRELWQAHLRNKGRHGSPAARLLLQGAGDGARSHAERLLVQLMKSAGITGWVANYPIGRYKVDVAFTDDKLVIEVDGWAFHSDPATFREDRARQNQIALLGWQVLRFTWFDLTEQPERVIAEIRRVLSAR
ncbi:type IV toxin-antitoxin system AbiEi family antitoxin domain-containing protein [soil metagenome]